MLKRDVLPESGYEMSRTYKTLIKAFWPGPLTLLFPVGVREEETRLDGTDANSDSDARVVAVGQKDAGALKTGKRRTIPEIVTAGHRTVAVRMPAHPVARTLIALAGAPIAAPSANTSGRPSPTRADHVFRDLGGKVGIILDDGRTADVGLESTVVDGLDGDLRVLRPGGVTVEDLERVLAEDASSNQDSSRSAPVKVLVHRRDYSDDVQESAPTTPGMKYKHYAPTAPVILLVHDSPGPSSSPSSAIDTYRREIIPSFIASLIERFPPDQNITIGLLLTSDSPLRLPLETAIKDIGSRHLVSPTLSPSHRAVTLPRLGPATASDDHNSLHPNPPIELPSRISIQFAELGTTATPQVTAQRLFDGLLTLDHDGVDTILVESIDEHNEGLAIMNRVRKAAGETRWVATA
jgi:L-threonylcarbamoyladenylate synthase